MSDLPEHIHIDKLREAFDLLGLPFDDTLSLTIEPRAITIEQPRTGERGGWLVAGDNLATVTTTIGIERPRP